MRCSASASSACFAASCAAGDRCCRAQPPQTPKCAQRGSTRSGDGLQHLEQVGLVVLAVADAAHEADLLAGQCAGDERGLRAAHHAGAIVVQAGDHAGLGLDGGARDGAVDAAAAAAHGAARSSTATATIRPASSVSVTWPSPMPRRRRTSSPRGE
jgi:hypothetical protein